MDSLESQSLASQVSLDAENLSNKEQFAKNGFYLLRLSDEELQQLREIVTEHYLLRIQLLDIELVREFLGAPLHDYHKFCHLLDHGSVWTKAARILSPVSTAKIAKMPFIDRLREDLGDFLFADIDSHGWQEMNWRIVRPGSEDIGPLHTNAWFWQCEDSPAVVADRVRVKIWIPIYIVPGLAGFQLIPGSQLKDWEWEAVERHGRPKPRLKEEVSPDQLLEPFTEPGHGIVFDDRIVHGGTVNRSDQTRFSLEFSMWVDPKQLDV